MTNKKVFYVGKGILKPLDILSMRARIIDESRLTKSVMGRYGDFMVVIDTSSGIVEHSGKAVTRRHVERLNLLENWRGRAARNLEEAEQVEEPIVEQESDEPVAEEPPATEPELKTEDKPKTPVYTESDLLGLSKTKLQEICETLGLSNVGLKAELMSRIIASQV